MTCQISQCHTGETKSTKDFCPGGFFFFFFFSPPAPVSSFSTSSSSSSASSSSSGSSWQRQGVKSRAPRKKHKNILEWVALGVLSSFEYAKVYDTQDDHMSGSKNHGHIFSFGLLAASAMASGWCRGLKEMDLANAKTLSGLSVLWSPSAHVWAFGGPHCLDHGRSNQSLQPGGTKSREELSMPKRMSESTDAQM